MMLEFPIPKSDAAEFVSVSGDGTNGPSLMTI
jgi:hypothetical protein